MARLTDEGETVRLIRHAIDSGVNYLDLGYPYDRDRQERRTRAVGRALGDGYRQRVRTSASLPSTLVRSAADFDRWLDDQLDWLGAERADFLMLAGLDRDTWPRMQELNVLDWAEKARADGRFDWLGFSFHDQFQFLRDIVESYDRWTFCRFQYSYMDVDHHPGASGLRFAAENGLAVVAAEPLKRGRLASPPESIAPLWENAGGRLSPAGWGLRFVWDHPEISTVVCNITSLEELDEALASADRAGADPLTIKEKVLIGQVRDAYRRLRPINCTSCRNCMPCPEGIDVPRIFEIYNDAIMYADTATARLIYREEGHRIEDCTGCGICEERCGRQITIREWLEKARRLLANE